ncbi:MAG: hypothetical protein FWD31_16065, partial [Planctomycetaceae bacterium]|nr:hypothetical protein [Planctomycetaceae bacterium]
DLMWRIKEKEEEELAPKLEGVTDTGERDRIHSEFYKKLWPELRPELDEVTESRIRFINQMKFKMFDVLTDEQFERMTDLIDNPPDYVKKVIAQMRKMRGEDDSESNEWGSWQPGDGIPAEYLKHRQEMKKRFPKK